MTDSHPFPITSDTPSIDDYMKAVIPPRALVGGAKLRGISHKESGPDKPVITVVTAVLNGGKTLEQTILSVLNQTYAHVEYIVMDGGSTDGTIDVLHKYNDKITYWMSSPDRGLYDAMNRGIALSSGTYINLLNADDYLEPDAAELIAHKCRELNSPSIIYGHAYAVDDKYAVKSELLPNEKYWLGMSINHQTMFVHRELFSTVGLFNIDYTLAADYDFLVRCFKNNVHFYGIIECIVNYRNAGISAGDCRYRHEASHINKKYFGSRSSKRIAFLIFNFLWMPFKLNFRALMYNTLGINITRRVINIYKKIIFRS